MLLGEDVMLHVKKLRLLQKKGDDIPPDKAIEKTRKYLTVVGNAIGNLCSRADGGQLAGTKLTSAELHAKLWQVHCVDMVATILAIHCHAACPLLNAQKIDALHHLLLSLVQLTL